MSSSYSKVAKQLAEQSGDVDRAPCRECDTPTARATLANYGGQCFGCYEAYCRPGMHGGPKGFLTGAGDTPTQAEMRKRVRDLSAPVNVLQRDVAFDPTAIEMAKREAARKVAEYSALHLAKDGQDVSLERINAELRLSGDLQ